MDFLAIYRPLRLLISRGLRPNRNIFRAFNDPPAWIGLLTRLSYAAADIGRASPSEVVTDGTDPGAPTGPAGVSYTIRPRGVPADFRRAGAGGLCIAAVPAAATGSAWCRPR